VNNSITCIFCNNEHQSTDEHIIPEFLGGTLVIKEVCKDCNSKMGSDFEGPLSRSVIFRLPRHLYGIQGKSMSPINAFPGTGTTDDGTKIRLDSEFKPYMVAKVDENKLEGGVEVNLVVDASDKDRIPQIIEAKIRRTAKNEWPDMTSAEVDALVKNALDALPTEYQTRKSQPTIKYSESIDINHLTLLMMKIAYEIAYHHFGSKVLKDVSNNKLRDATCNRDAKPEISGRLFPEPDPFLYVTAPENSHCVILCKNMCYMRLFNVTAIIQVSEKESTFSLTEENWVIYWFNYTDKEWKKENFLSHISGLII
jgi:hypothetical protein